MYLSQIKRRLGWRSARPLAPRVPSSQPAMTPTVSRSDAMVMLILILKPFSLLQKSLYHRFLVYDPYDKYFPFAIETFKLPASCACYNGAFIESH